MATKDATIVLKGDQCVVRKVELILNAKGGYDIGVYGETKTDIGKTVGLDPGVMLGVEADEHKDALWTEAMSILRKANGLET